MVGLFAPVHMPYFLNETSVGNPTLEQMTRTSIQMLQKEANGYVLLVEGPVRFNTQLHLKVCIYLYNFKNVK